MHICRLHVVPDFLYGFNEKNLWYKIFYNEFYKKRTTQKGGYEISVLKYCVVVALQVGLFVTVGSRNKVSILM